MRHGLVGLIVSALAAGGADVAAQSAYPVPPRPLPDGEEIALATSAAPAAIAAGAGPILCPCATT